jgi:hypothetical protein
MICRQLVYFWRASSASASMCSTMPLNQGVRQPLLHGFFAPGIALLFDLALAFDRFAELDQPLGGVRSAVEEHVFVVFVQRLVVFLIDFELAGVDDDLVQPGGDRGI